MRMMNGLSQFHFKCKYHGTSFLNPASGMYILCLFYTNTSVWSFRSLPVFMNIAMSAIIVVYRNHHGAGIV